MTKELSQVLAAVAVRRLSQEEELNLKPVHWRQRRGWSFRCISIHSLQVYHSSTDIWKDVSSFVTSSMRPAQTSCPCWWCLLGFPANIGLWRAWRVDDEGTSRSRVFVLRFGRKLARYVRLMKSFYGLTSASHITQKLSQLWWKPMSTVQCLWCRYSDNGEFLNGVIGIHVDDFLIGLADGWLGEKWMSEIVFVSLGILEDFGIWICWKPGPTTSWLFHYSWPWRQHQRIHHWSSHHTWTIKTATWILDSSRAQYVARCTWHCLLESSANVSSVCCGCEFAVECDGSSRGTRSSGRQQAGPRYASQFCTVSSFSLSPSRWISDRRLRDNSDHWKVVWTWSRRRCQRVGLAILQTCEENFGIKQWWDSSSCICRRILLVGLVGLFWDARCFDAALAFCTKRSDKWAVCSWQILEV